jgi:hypothetical protein
MGPAQLKDCTSPSNLAECLGWKPGGDPTAAAKQPLAPREEGLEVLIEDQMRFETSASQVKMLETSCRSLTIYSAVEKSRTTVRLGAEPHLNVRGL